MVFEHLNAIMGDHSNLWHNVIHLFTVLASCDIIIPISLVVRNTVVLCKIVPVSYQNCGIL